MDDHSRTAIAAAVAGEMDARMADSPLLNDSLAVEFYTSAKKKRIPVIGLETALSGERMQQLGELCSVSVAWKRDYCRGAFAGRPAGRPDSDVEGDR